MDVYLEPHFPQQTLMVPDLGSWQEPVGLFLSHLGYEPKLDSSLPRMQISDWSAALLWIAQFISQKTGNPLRPFRETKGERPSDSLPALEKKPVSLVMLGQSRITEELSRLFQILGWSVQAYAQKAEPSAFAQGTSVCELPLNFSEIKIPNRAWVIVASHHQMDHEMIAHALESKADYIGLVASAKRSGLILENLSEKKFSTEALSSFFAPAGLTLPTETPAQIAFSIVSEILFCQDPI